MADEDEYGPVQYEKRRPLRKWIPEGSLQGRPMLSQPVTSYKLLNRSTEKERPERATGDKNRASRARPDPGPTRQRVAPPAVDELLRQIDEEESNRLNVLDGYNPTPPRPREGFGLQLRPRHDDINEYFTGPKWDDPRGIERGPPYLEVVETRPKPRPIPKPLPPPAIIRSKPAHREIGEKVDRPKPPPPEPVPKVFKANDIIFEGYSPEDAANRRPAVFRGNGYLAEIQKVADILRNNPGHTVRIRASVASDGRPAPPFFDEQDIKNWIKLTMIQRNRAVANQLKARGIDSRRISTELGDVGSKEEDRKVEFFFDAPTR